MQTLNDDLSFCEIFDRFSMLFVVISSSAVFSISMYVLLSPFAPLGALLC